MHRIIKINSSTDLDQLRKALAQAHSLRVTVETDGVCFKIDGGIWSAPMGSLDPECQAAQDNSRPSLSELASATRDQTPLTDRAYIDLLSSGREVPETEEPDMCWCGRHYASLNHNEFVRM